MAKALRQRKTLDFSSEKPTLKTATTGTKAEKVRQDKEYELEFNIDMKKWKEKCEILVENEKRAYADLFTDAWSDDNMRCRVEQVKNFKSEILDNPYKTIDEMKIFMVNPVRTQHYMIRIKRTIITVCSASLSLKSPSVIGPSAMNRKQAGLRRRLELTGSRFMSRAHPTTRRHPLMMKEMRCSRMSGETL